jgi:DegV family protein with EDD domain
VVAAIEGVQSLDGLRLSHALQAGLLRLLSQQEHLNKINVFPVPDGDTGTNLALTARAVLATLRKDADAHAGHVLDRAADAALDGARGNSGALLAQFLLGAASRISEYSSVGTADWTDAVHAGADHARESVSEPREGTILTVFSDYARSLAQARAHGVTDMVLLMRHGLEAAQRSLERTPLQLEVLRKANVVDAGAQGFVELLAGLTGHLESGATEAPPIPASDDFVVTDAAAETTAGHEEDLSFRYCTECMVTGDSVDRRGLRERLAQLGGSLVIAGSSQKVCLHVHANDPATVFRVASEFGGVSGEKADDMQRQQHAAHTVGQAVVIVTDSAADLPEDEVDRLGIHMVPVRVHFGERSFLDKVGITPQEFFDELARTTEIPKTSQPPPGDFRRLFEFLGSHFPEVVSVNLTSRASGTFASAEAAAARAATHGRVYVVDSLNASTGQGLLVMYAAECAAAGYSAAQVIAATRVMIPRTYTYGLIGSLDLALRGGRLPRWVKRLADLFHASPVLHADRRGHVTGGGMLFGRTDLRRKFMRFVRRRMRDDCTYRLLVGHANCERDALELLEGLRAPNVAYARVLPIGSGLGVHGGPGMLVVGLQEYEPPEPR